MYLHFDRQDIPDWVMHRDFLSAIPKRSNFDDVAPTGSAGY